MKKQTTAQSQLSVIQQLKYQAEFDSLTGIYNKNRFYKAAHEMLTANPDTGFIMVRFDVDRFHLINAFYGRKEGDRLLIYIAGQLSALAHDFPPAVYGRIDGDLFAFCIPVTDTREIAAVIQRLTASIKSFSTTFDIVPTYGICPVENHGEDIDRLLDKASLAAKQVKDDYVLCYRLYTPDLSKTVTWEQEITNTMNQALATRQFIMYLQPQYALKTGKLSGAEALIRWADPAHGFIQPNEFIPLFERNGFIIKLDYFIWEQACMLLRRWLDAGIHPVPVSVNISRAEIFNPHLISMICNLTKKYQIPPKLLHLEITESAYTDKPQAMQKVIQDFQKEGFFVLMDDFGSGYSSLNILKELPVDALKVDMEFLSDSQNNKRGEIILRSVIQLAKDLEIPAIAEGVETRKQAGFLQSIGCDYAQGFYYSPAIPSSEFERLL